MGVRICQWSWELAACFTKTPSQTISTTRTKFMPCFREREELGHKLVVRMGSYKFLFLLNSGHCSLEKREIQF